MPSQKCQCGHDRVAHEHYRVGTECALCPPEQCTAYSGPREPWWSPLIPGILRKRDAPANPKVERPDERWNDGVTG